jgi:hypothetical protein
LGIRIIGTILLRLLLAIVSWVALRIGSVISAELILLLTMLEAAGLRWTERILTAGWAEVLVLTVPLLRSVALLRAVALLLTIALLLAVALLLAITLLLTVALLLAVAALVVLIVAGHGCGDAIWTE